jgi:anti-sigma factor RsiW
MRITREVILDLLPLYVSGEASSATRTLVEEYLSQHPELTEQVVRLKSEDHLDFPEITVPPELAMRSLRRTKKLLAWQRWLFGPAIFLTLFSLSFETDISGGRIREFHFLLRDSPLLAGCLAIGIGCWIAYFVVRRRLSPGLTGPFRKGGHS